MFTTFISRKIGNAPRIYAWERTANHRTGYLYLGDRGTDGKYAKKWQAEYPASDADGVAISDFVGYLQDNNLVGKPDSAIINSLDGKSLTLVYAISDLGGDGGWRVDTQLLQVTNAPKIEEPVESPTHQFMSNLCNNVYTGGSVPKGYYSISYDGKFDDRKTASMVQAVLLKVI